MLGLDQTKCLYRLLFISLIACSSPKVPPWTVIKEPFMNRGQIQLEGKGDASCMFCGRIFFFSYQPTCAVEALKRTRIPSIQAERDAFFRCPNMLVMF